MIYLAFFVAKKKVDHILKPETLPSTEWEGQVDHILKPYFCICLLMFFVFSPLGWFKDMIYLFLARNAYFCRMGKVGRSYP